MQFLMIGLGGALGALSRQLWTSGAAKLFGAGFPWGVAGANVTGSFIMGVVAAQLTARGAIPSHLSAFLMTGFLGGFTTFSAFSLDAVRLIEAGRHCAAAAYIAGSVSLSILALWLGLIAGKAA